MKDSKGCEEVKTFVIGGGGSSIGLAIESTDATCGVKGSAWVYVTGGQPGFTVRIWGNGVDKTVSVNSNGFQLSDISAGSYSLSVKDSKGCEQVKTFVIGGGGSSIGLAIETNDATCGSKGSAWVDVTGGQPGFTVRIWGNGVDKTCLLYTSPSPRDS